MLSHALTALNLTPTRALVLILFVALVVVIGALPEAQGPGKAE